MQRFQYNFILVENQADLVSRAVVIRYYFLAHSFRTTNAGAISGESEHWTDELSNELNSEVLINVTDLTLTKEDIFKRIVL